jgi:glycosyltransferase involved in cell wall biosynthesis
MLADWESMTISVGMPAYSAAGFVQETLESGLRHTLPSEEILVIDDGSTDDPATVDLSFGSPVRVIRRPNSRQGASRNEGQEVHGCNSGGILARVDKPSGPISSRVPNAQSAGLVDPQTTR